MVCLLAWYLSGFLSEILLIFSFENICSFARILEEKNE